MYRWLLVVISLISASTMVAQSRGQIADSEFNPETVVISRFSFARPAHWQWVDTRSDVPNVTQSVTFEVNYPGNNNACRAYFNHFEPHHPAGDRKLVVKRWKDSFPDSTHVAFGQPQLIGTNKVSYLEVDGRFKPFPKTNEIRQGYRMVGALVEEPDGNLIIRLLGPSEWVKKATPDFKKMIEDALREDKE